MWLLAKLFPFRHRPELESHPYEEVRARYRPWDYALVILFAVLAPICVYGLHAFFLWHTASLDRDFGGAVYVVVPNSNFWYAPALVLGVILACAILSVFYHRVLGKSAMEYRHSSNFATGINASRLYLVFGLLMGGGFGILAILAANSSLRLMQDEIVVHRLFSSTDEHYPYDRVKALRQVATGDGGSHFIIEFDGAPDWSTAVEVVFPGPSAIAYLSQRSGRPVLTTASP